MNVPATVKLSRVPTIKQLEARAISYLQLLSLAFSSYEEFAKLAKSCNDEIDRIRLYAAQDRASVTRAQRLPGTAFGMEVMLMMFSDIDVKRPKAPLVRDLQALRLRCHVFLDAQSAAATVY